MRPKRASRWLVPAALGSAALALAFLADTRSASAFGGGIHETITRNALPFVKTSVLNVIVAGDLDEDQGAEADLAERHAQNCRFREWCRLLHLSRDLDPTFMASGRLLGTWVGTDSGTITPHIAGTACERGAVRHHRVEISATPGADAPSGAIPFVVFRSDFTSSARSSVGRQATQTLRICGDTNEQIVATLVPERIRGAILVVPVPGTARTWTVRDHRGAFSATFVIKVTPNAC